MKWGEVVGGEGSEEDGDDFSSIVVLGVPNAVIEAAGIRLDESGWQHSGEKGLMVRVDPERPEMRQKRHVHVASQEHARSKKKQASWNDDLTRHDRKTFNAKLGGQRAYQDAARSALGLPPDAVLEAVQLDPQMLRESSEDGPEPAAAFRLRAPSRARRLFDILTESRRPPRTSTDKS